VFGTERRMTRMRRVFSEKAQATHMPKSAITISDDRSLVRERMFSGLFTKPRVRSKYLAEDGKGNDKGEG